LKRELGVSCLLDLNHEPNSPFWAAERERLTCVLLGDGIHILELAIGTSLDHAATKLGFLIRIVETDNLERHTRIASGVLRLK